MCHKIHIEGQYSWITSNSTGDRLGNEVVEVKSVTYIMISQVIFKTISTPVLIILKAEIVICLLVRNIKFL